MEDPEPEQKRIKRIAEHIEDEIDRAQHLPLEELTRHKAAMVHMLQFLSIEEAYAVSLVSRRIYEWFQQNDIWYVLAQRWLTPERVKECERGLEKIGCPTKRIHYLWLLLAEHIHVKLTNVEGYAQWFYMELSSSRNDDVKFESRGQGYWVMTCGRSDIAKDMILQFGQATIVLPGQSYDQNNTVRVWLPSNKTKYGLSAFQIVYVIFFQTRMSYVRMGRSNTRIRSKLGN